MKNTLELYYFWHYLNGQYWLDAYEGWSWRNAECIAWDNHEASPEIRITRAWKHCAWVWGEQMPDGVISQLEELANIAGAEFDRGTA